MGMPSPGSSPLDAVHPDPESRLPMRAVRTYGRWLSQTALPNIPILHRLPGDSPHEIGIALREVNRDDRS